MTKTVLGIAGIAATLAVAAPAAAQMNDETSVASPAPDEGAAAAGDGDIIVTAQRRSERLVDVPASVVAISGEALAQAGVNGIEDLTRQAPGVLINKTGAYVQPTVRGIGASVQGGGAESNIAVYVDGVYFASQTGAMFDLVNLESVQVLKGPQGTLFGRNATGGALLLTTLTPSFTPTGKAFASFGRFNEYKLSAYASTGLTDTLAADISVYRRHTNGFIRDLRTGERRGEQSSFDIRGKLLFEPSDAVRFILAASHTETKDPSGLTYTTLNGNSVGRNFANSGPIAVERGTSSQEIATRIEAKVNTVSLRSEIDLGFATLNTISGYIDEQDFIDADLDSSYAPSSFATYDQFNESFSQEINLTSPSGGDFSWVAGLYYYWNAAGSENWRLNGNPFYRARITSNSISGFADGTYDLGPVSLIAGLRYSKEKRGFQRGFPGGAYTVDTDVTYTSWTPRAGLRVDVGPRSNVYATFSQGFKSGTYNLSSPSTTPVRPEKITAYEAGFKSASRAIDFNIAAYHYDYRDIQVTAYDYTSGVSRLFNAARARVHGIESDATWRPADNFDLRAGFAWTHARFKSFPGAPAFFPRTTLTNGTPCPDLNCGNAQVNVDASGNKLLRAPEFTISAGANYHLELAGGSKISFGVRPYWSSKINYSFQERISQPSYFTVDADISYSPNDQLRLSIWGRNLTDTKYATSRSESSARDAIAWAQPVTYGISASYNF